MGKFIICAQDTPDGKDVMITYSFDVGRCTGYEYEEEAAPSSLRDRKFTPVKDGLARLMAAYDTLVKVDKGEMEPADALNSPDYKIEGNMMMMLPLMQAIDSWTNKVRELDKEY